jgi:integrase/recombinase XerC
MSTDVVPFTAELDPRNFLAERPSPDRVSIDLLALVVAGLKPTSAKGYIQDLRRFADWSGSESIESALTSLYALDTPRANVLILAFQSAMESLAPATSNRRVAAVKRALKVGRRVGLTSIVLEVDRRKAEILRDTAGPGRRGWDLMLAAATTAAAAGDPAGVRNLAVVLLLHDRALRRGELVALDWPVDVDFERRAVSILGKGRGGKEWLTVSDRALAALRAWVELRGVDWSGPVFVRLDQAAGDRRERLSGEAVNSVVKALVASARLGRKSTAHGLRHQAITQALDDGWDVRDVKEFSRHRNVETVIVYDDRRRDVGGQISRSISGSGRSRRGRS